MSFFVNTMVCGFSLYQILAFFLIYSCLCTDGLCRTFIISGQHNDLNSHILKL